MRSSFQLFSSDLAIDLGTANTLVFAHGKGIIVNEPSIIAVNQVTGEVEAVGKEAKEMLGRTPGNIVAIKPMKDGVIADFKQTEKMLNYFIQKAHNRKMMVHPRIVIGVPSEITQVEKRAVMDSAYRAKASEVHLVEQAMVAAIGAGLPITEPGGNMVVDIGGGTTDIAVISLAGIVYSRSVRMAGNQMDEAIITYIKRKYNLLIGERTAEQIKMELGSAYPLDKPLTKEITGRNLIEGVPKTITIDDSEIREALSECIATIINAIRVALERTPPELSADISDRGIVLTGGGALIKNLDKRIREETGLPVSMADDPLASVVLGTGKMLSEFQAAAEDFDRLRPYCGFFTLFQMLLNPCLVLFTVCVAPVTFVLALSTAFVALFVVWPAGVPAAPPPCCPPATLPAPRGARLPFACRFISVTGTFCMRVDPTTIATAVWVSGTSSYSTTIRTPVLGFNSAVGKELPSVST